MSLKRHIPNAVTLLNLFSGCVALIFAVHGNFIAASIFVFLGIFFDFFDGLLARKLNVQSPLGIQLDSLADLVTSGVVPGVIMFKLISLTIDAPNFLDNNDSWNSVFNWQGFKGSVLPLIGLLIPLASAYRLAKFNLDEDQQSYFKGLPVPASCYLLNSNIKLFALKFKNWGFKDNAVRYIFLILSVVLLIILQFGAIPFVIGLYVILSLLIKRHI